MHYSVIRSGWQNAFSRNKNAIARPKIAAISIISRHLIVLQASSEPGRVVAFSAVKSIKPSPIDENIIVINAINDADEWSNLGAQDGDDAFQWLQQQGMGNYNIKPGDTIPMHRPFR